MAAKCPRCGETGTKLPWDQGAHEDGWGMRAATLHRNPAAFLLATAIFFGKKTISTAYECRSCKRTWRAWFE